MFTPSPLPVPRVFNTALRGLCAPLRLALALAALAAAPLARAAPAAPAPKPKPLQAITLLLLQDLRQGDTVSPATCHLETAEGVASVSLPPGQPQGPYLRPASARLALFAERPAPLPPGQTVRAPGAPATIRVPLAEAAVEETWRNVLVIVSLDASGAVRQLRPLDQSLPSLAPGRIAVVSYVDRAVALKIGASENLVPPRGRIQISVTTPSGRAETVLYQSAVEIDGRWQRVESRGLTVKPGWRQLALVLPQDDGIQMVLLPPAGNDPPEPPPAAAL